MKKNGLHLFFWGGKKKKENLLNQPSIAKRTRAKPMEEKHPLASIIYKCGGEEGKEKSHHTAINSNTVFHSLKKREKKKGSPGWGG